MIVVLQSLSLYLLKLLLSVSFDKGNTSLIISDLQQELEKKQENLCNFFHFFDSMNKNVNRYNFE